MSHKPNLLTWDQEVAASPHEFHETDNNRTNFAAVLATWQYFFFRHNYQVFETFILPQIIANYYFLFYNVLSLEQGKSVSRSPENYHLLQK